MGNFITSIARAVSIGQEITVTIVFTFLVLLSRLVWPLIRLRSKLAYTLDIKNIDKMFNSIVAYG